MTSKLLVKVAGTPRLVVATRSNHLTFLPPLTFPSRRAINSTLASLLAIPPTFPLKNRTKIVLSSAGLDHVVGAIPGTRAAPLPI